MYVGLICVSFSLSIGLGLADTMTQGDLKHGMIYTELRKQDIRKFDREARSEIPPILDQIGNRT